MTTQKELYDITYLFSENHLQELINKPGEKGLFKPVSFIVFGLPNDLLNANVISCQTEFYGIFDKVKSSNYRPDCICEDHNNRYVIELKRAAKFEPLGIAEVIHHVACQEMVKNIDNKNMVPVLIGSFNTWNRIVVNKLSEFKFYIRYYEVYILSEKSAINRSKRNISFASTDVMWFYDPFKNGRNWKNAFESADETNDRFKISYRYDDNSNSDKYLISDFRQGA
jgi:hypothetical protein